MEVDNFEPATLFRHSVDYFFLWYVPRLGCKWSKVHFPATGHSSSEMSCFFKSQVLLQFCLLRCWMETTACKNDVRACQDVSVVICD